MYREEVSTDILQGLQADLAPINGIPDESDTADTGQQLLERFVQSLVGVDLKVVKGRLATEYASLFLNVGKKPVFPFESVYTSSDHLVMQRARDEVVNLYRQEGLARAESFREPEDHIAIEFEFMAYLCQKSVEALQADKHAQALFYLTKQREFLIKHLLVWVPSFCDDVEQAAKSDLYRGVARLTKDLLFLEQDTIANAIAQISKT
jgi:TorA maturation chaperone TorD